MHFESCAISHDYQPKRYENIESTDMCLNLHHMCTLSDISVECAFRNQLCSGVEIKLKEFNFKVRHDIFPCNSNL